eukprot:7185847-Lingulodinium_polyedra.AAC.1
MHRVEGLPNVTAEDVDRPPPLCRLLKPQAERLRALQHLSPSAKANDLAPPAHLLHMLRCQFCDNRLEEVVKARHEADGPPIFDKPRV